MSRISVMAADPYGDDPPRLVGWFESTKADRWSDWSRDRDRGQAVIRTAAGRWVMQDWSNWQGEADTYRFITPDEAREWLLVNDFDDVVRERLGDIEEEAGPGRPEIGNPVTARLGNLLPALETWASEHHLTRSDALRQLLATALGVQA